ncbi:glycosyltransferase family 4 protein [Psychroflexus sp. YR1-1]|uniref:Glycosyltransferase family 4 protein n=1 Tax=Psychroflexus aurantiacus TaxID=2709310 RepID=A0A6B3R020_9FLAO|nr:glycosyltransferase family 4 protein [Psychroflexus aurantiacus]NEV93923.1 glycosyltransferase family 4 protein [Psychroflexus aurantiacus]
MSQTHKKNARSKQLLYLGNQLSRKGRNLSTVEVLSGLLETEGYTVVSGSSRKNPAFRLLDMLYKVIKHRPQTDLLLIDTYSTSAFWYAYVISRLACVLKLDYIPILHGGNLPQRLKTHSKRCRHLFGRAKVNVAPSAWLMHHFQKAGYTNLTHIPNSIALEHYEFRQRQPLMPRLLWVRAFAQIYNPLLTLKTLQELLHTHPEASLSMVGPFKDESIDECRAYAEAHQLPVTFTGGMSKSAWIKYAADFDIFINTTNVDNMPVSVLEAMALGLPVVSTNVGGIPFLLEDEVDALLVDPGNAGDFTKAILKLLQDPDLARQLSITARQKVEHFDWQVVKGKWNAVISGER